MSKGQRVNGSSWRRSAGHRVDELTGQGLGIGLVRDRGSNMDNLQDVLSTMHRQFSQTVNTVILSSFK